MIIASAVLATYYHYQFSILIMMLLPFLLLATFLHGELLLRQSIVASDALNRAKLVSSIFLIFTQHVVALPREGGAS